MSNDTDLNFTLRQLLRFLCFRTPAYAEKVWASGLAARAAPKDHWLEVSYEKGAVGWVRFNSDGSQRTIFSHPNVADSEIIKLDVKVDYELSDLLFTLIESIQDPAAQATLMLELLPIYKLMMNGGLDHQFQSSYLELCRTALRQNPTTIEERQDSFVSSLPTALHEFRCIGSIVSRLSILRRVWSGMSDKVIRAIDDEGATFKYADQLVSYTLDFIFREGGFQRIERIARSFHDEGRNCLQLAREEDADDRFYEILGDAGWHFYSAWYLLARLNGAASSNPSNSEYIRKLSRASEEFHTVCMSSLHNSLANSLSGGGQVRGLVDRLKEAKSRGAEDNVHSIIDSAIHHELLYPRKWRERILGMI
jgi:hypothetical protein